MEILPLYEEKDRIFSSLDSMLDLLKLIDIIQIWDSNMIITSPLLDINSSPLELFILLIINLIVVLNLFINQVLVLSLQQRRVSIIESIIKRIHHNLYILVSKTFLINDLNRTLQNYKNVTGVLIFHHHHIILSEYSQLTLII